MRGCGSFSAEVSQVAEGTRMKRTQRALEQWFSIGVILSLGEHLAMLRDTFELSHLGKCHWHVVERGK